MRRKLPPPRPQIFSEYFEKYSTGLLLLHFRSAGNPNRDTPGGAFKFNQGNIIKTYCYHGNIWPEP